MTAGVERGPLQRATPAANTIIVGQGTASQLGTALAATPTAIIGVSVQCPTDSQESIFVGNQFNQFREVIAGGTQELEILDLSDVYVRSATGNGTYNYIAGVA